MSPVGRLADSAAQVRPAACRAAAKGSERFPPAVPLATGSKKRWFEGSIGRSPQSAPDGQPGSTPDLGQPLVVHRPMEL